jgi:hypothetical protein
MPPELVIKWFVNCNFAVMATTEVEAISKLADALHTARIVRVSEAPAITGFHITHATEEGEGG